MKSTIALTLLAGVLGTVTLAHAAALPEPEARSLCSSYKQIYSGDKTVSRGHGIQTVTVEQLGYLGLGRVYLPGPGLVNQGEANTACKAACSLGINGKSCQSVTVYHKCSDAGGDPFITCGDGGKDTSTGGFWYCDFYTDKLKADDFKNQGSTQNGFIRTSNGFVQTC